MKKQFHKNDHLSATTIAQASYCEKKLVLNQKFGQQSSDLDEIRRQRGDEEHLRHHLASVKHGGHKDSRCFIATEIYGPVADQTNLLRNFRDTVLARSFLGRLFISVYYEISPFVVVLVKKFPVLRKQVKRFLDKLVKGLSTHGA